jgi:hypothetical protein
LLELFAALGSPAKDFILAGAQAIKFAVQEGGQPHKADLSFFRLTLPLPPSAPIDNLAPRFFPSIRTHRHRATLPGKLKATLSRARAFVRKFEDGSNFFQDPAFTRHKLVIATTEKKYPGLGKCLPFPMLAPDDALIPSIR